LVKGIQDFLNEGSGTLQRRNDGKNGLGHSKIFSRTTWPEKLVFAWKLSDKVQILLIDCFGFYAVSAIFQPYYGNCGTIMFGLEVLVSLMAPMSLRLFRKSGKRPCAYQWDCDPWHHLKSHPKDLKIEIQTSKTIHKESVYVHIYISS
jgi:hypothetical protein